MTTIRVIPAWIVLAGLMTWASAVNAQTANTVSDTFTGSAANNPWIPFNDACLTAATTAGTTATLGACTSTVDSTKDSPGSGALRLTPGGSTGNQTGAIISSTPFNASQGIQVTFTTYTYGGNSYNGGPGYPNTGADGIAFYLLNSNVAPNLGSFGGSLGYSCANAKATSTTSPAGSDGMAGAYLGLGMDEFGNFLNSGDNTYTGVAVGTGGTTGASQSGAYSIASNPYAGGTLTVVDSGGSEFQPGRIGMRGYGNVNLAALTAAAKAAGATSIPTNTDVENTCLNGGTYNYTVPNPNPITYTYTYTYNNGAKNTNYSGALYQRGGSKPNYTYTAEGNTISGATTNTNGGYTGTGSPYAQIIKNNTTNYYVVTENQTQASSATISASTTFADYPVIPYANMILPSTTPISTETATTRTAAKAINYKLQVTSTGLLSLWYSYNGGNYNAVITGQDISKSNGQMPSSFLFGFGASTGGGTNVHEITCFLATPADLSASSAGLNVQQAGSVRTGTQVYLAYYHPSNWWGELDADQLIVNGTTVSISPVATWDASCVLTGGSCSAMDTTSNPNATVTAQASRTLVTWGGMAGIPFAESQLSSVELGWLEAGTTTGTTGATNLVNYLSGGRNNEIPASGATGTQIYRSRTSVLGDIIDSSPTWVGPPTAPYTAIWADSLYSTVSIPENATGATTYTTFATNNATRLNMVYNGANDGFMHAFETGSYAADGVTFDSTTNDGKELFAYMPQAVLQTIHNGTVPALDYSSPNYGHNFFVDATPGTGDLFYNNTWHTWLVGGLGPGGNAIYAIDITNPTTLGAGSVIGEWGANTGTTTAPATGSINPVTSLSAGTGTNPLTCSGDTSTSGCASNLGQTYGTPQIRRLHNGEWGIIFGNGLNSATGHAGIYVMTLKPADGTIDTVYYLDSGVAGTTAKPDGISYVTPVDLDGDHITDYVYAGDVYGNVWRFDLTSKTASNWAVTNYGSGTSAQPLFATPSISACTPPTSTGCTTVTTKQPITTALVVLSVAPDAIGTPRIMVEFGTGAVTPQTNTAAIQYAPGQQALYGIWDWKVGVTGTAAANYTGLSGSSAPTTAITTSQLQQQSVTSTGNVSTTPGTTVNVRTVSNASVCYAGSSCTGTAAQYGWYMNLPGFNLPGFTGTNGVGGSNQTEQVIYSPIGSEGAFIVNTTIPANNGPLTCTVANAQGWTMALDPATGGSFAQSFFSVGSSLINLNGQPVSGIAVNATGSPSVVTAVGNPYLISQTVTGTGTVNQINPVGSKGGRLTWIELH